jgi:hypothetical protein
MNIGIFGLSYCGSTMLSYIFSNHSKVFSVGESHWLVDPKPKWCNHDTGKCIICRDFRGVECDFFTPEFRAKLTKETLPIRVAERAKELYNIDNVIYSDKNFMNYKVLFKKAKLDKAIFLFKRPEGFIHSYLRHTKHIYPEKSLYQIFRQGLVLYEQASSNNRIWLDEYKINTLYVFLEDFQRDPVKILKHICHFLGLEYEEGMEEYWNNNPTFHQIGGNSAPRLSFQSKEQVANSFFRFKEDPEWYLKINKQIVLDERWKTLEPEYLTKTQQHPSQRVFQTLMDRRTYE